MNIEYVPLLQLQRDLYGIPRGLQRFREYIDTMRDDEGDLELPLVAMNPMGKDHVPALLDEYLALNADEVAAKAVAQALPTLTHVSGNFKATLILADDLHGQWTNRFAVEYDHRFATRPFHRRGWLPGNLWSSEAADLAAVRSEILSTIYRAAHIQQHGYAQNLRQMMIQEGYALVQAEAKLPTLDADEIEYTREVIKPYLDSDELPITMVCLYGDTAAHELGYPPLGLSPYAGLVLALHEAHKSRESEIDD